MSGFSIDIRVYYEDTDSGGIVYYANYLRFMERARTEYLRRHGFAQQALRESHQRLFVVRSVAVDYLNPARLDDVIRVGAEISDCRRATLSFSQELTLADGTPLCRGQVRLACLDAETMRPAGIPGAILEALKS
ncbi:tol-pal system-associated acyl-CoA thioesterase [Granulosicoccaceae sp. 1_MG-2023]|nr:tol-pal system-associated acyl-CoA thioesterase [Granulosicoccaceae sp. 1_MG-2023]